MRVCDLRQKEVINICTCKSLGCPLDVEFDPKTGCLTAIIVPVPGKLCGLFGPASEYVIPWQCIKQIGEDWAGPRREPSGLSIPWAYARSS